MEVDDESEIKLNFSRRGTNGRAMSVLPETGISSHQVEDKIANEIKDLWAGCPSELHVARTVLANRMRVVTELVGGLVDYEFTSHVWLPQRVVPTCGSVVESTLNVAKE